MKYFKNTELASLYKISEKSVRNWIEAAQAGKIDLQLYQVGDKYHVANTLKNVSCVEQLVDKGKKYKNTRGFKAVRPTEEFYKTYSKKQILDIVSNLDTRKEIPLQYGYLDGGAHSWDNYSVRLSREQTPNVLTRTSELLDLSSGYVDRLTGPDRKINVVDLGPGNGLPIRSTLQRLIESGRLNRYIAIDISPDMLDILRSNITEWFGDKIKLETYVRDFSEERFDDITLEDRTGKADNPINLVFLLGGSLSNFRLPDYLLRVINNSLQRDDILFCSGYLDTSYTRRYFDLSGEGYDKKDPQQSGLIPNLLGMDESLCDFELLFNEKESSRLKTMRPKTDLSINFDLGGQALNVRLDLTKGEPVVLWRHKQYSMAGVISLFEGSDFHALQATRSEDQNYFLLITKIKTDN